MVIERELHRDSSPIKGFNTVKYVYALLLPIMLSFTNSLVANASDITVEPGAWVRLPPPVADTAVAYFTLRNPSPRDIELIGFNSTISEQAELHDTEMAHGMMKMHKLPQLRIKAGGTLRLQPGGKHLMLMRLKKPLHTGDQITIQIQRSHGDPIIVHAIVKDARHTPTMHH